MIEPISSATPIPMMGIVRQVRLNRDSGRYGLTRMSAKRVVFDENQAGSVTIAK